MFKKMYNSLSMPVHVEILFHADYVCVKTWSKISKRKHDDALDGDGVYDGHERSLTMATATDYLAFPAAASGVFHTKMPAAHSKGPMIKGEEFLPNIPAGIRDTYTTKLADTYWEMRSYSWIDPTDPSINSGELSDAACWVIGVGHTETLPGATLEDGDDEVNHTLPAFNALAYSTSSKAHPLRESRHNGAPVCVMLYRAFVADDFTNCSVTLKYNKGYGFSTNVLDGWTAGSGYNYLGELTEAMPSFVVTSGGGALDADATDTVEFKTVDADGNAIEQAATVYLESTGGYLPKTRITTTNKGLGTFKVTGLGLVSSETFKVKIGLRNYTGVTDVAYTIS